MSKDKKLYFGDPFLHTLALERASGISPNRAVLLENAVAQSLLHRYEPAEHRSLGGGFECSLLGRRSTTVQPSSPAAVSGGSKRTRPDHDHRRYREAGQRQR